MREYRANKQSEQNNYLAQVNDENTQKQPKSLVDMISKFHRIVNNGPVYVCSCCDQLWYKHSVSSTAKLREKSPNVDKYLLNKQVLATLNGCVHHAINIYPRIKFHPVLQLMACSFHQNLHFLI